MAFVTGLQGDDPHYLKVVSTPKHFAGNNQEDGRGHKNIVADERYLQEYELAGFRACIMEGKAQSIMAAYTAINGVPSSANKWLLTDVLRKQWGFQGYAVSDCGAVSNVTPSITTSPRRRRPSPPASTPASIWKAAISPSIPMSWITTCRPLSKRDWSAWIRSMRLLAKILTARFKLGMYDPPARVPYSKIPPSVIGSPEHIALARKLADESMVLLKNVPAGGAPLLPINPARVKKIVVVGPYADRPSSAITAAARPSRRPRRWPALKPGPRRTASA